MIKKNPGLVLKSVSKKVIEKRKEKKRKEKKSNEKKEMKKEKKRKEKKKEKKRKEKKRGIGLKRGDQLKVRLLLTRFKSFFLICRYM